jgi:two-component system, chemotaxis family, protein-glutamate methylesterase/glutaminase
MSGSGTSPPPVVVLGGSAGGLGVVRAVLAALPAELDAAVLVTMHTTDRPTNNLAAVLDRAGPLPAGPAEDGAVLRAGRVLVAPSDRHLVVRGGLVALSAGPPVNRHRPAVDVLFAGAARSHGRRAVAAVLSGMLDDGAVGAALVHRAGGVVVVQDPDDAAFDAMPRAALRAVPGARTATADTLGPVLARLVADLPAAPGGAPGVREGRVGRPAADASRASPGRTGGEHRRTSWPAREPPS